MDKKDFVKKKMENKMDISEKLLRILEKEKCNQKDLAVKIGASEKSIGRWLAGHTITQTNLRKISLKLDISMRWLTEKDYEGPMSKKAEWAYNVSKRRFSHREAAGIYDRIYEIMKALDIKNPAKLVALANINSRLVDDHYFLGHIPYPRDIEKISMATGYNKDYIIDGTAPRLDKKAPVIQHVTNISETIEKYGARLNSLEEEIKKLKHKNKDLKNKLSKQEGSYEKKQAVKEG